MAGALMTGAISISGPEDQPAVLEVWAQQEHQMIALRDLGYFPACQDLRELLRGLGAHPVINDGQAISSYSDQNHVEVTATGRIQCIADVKS